MASGVGRTPRISSERRRIMPCGVLLLHALVEPKPLRGGTATAAQRLERV
jgi:hypothetical protein